MTENEAKLARLKVLFTQLPPSIPEGERKGAIHQVLNNIHTANGWESFNTKFDTLFGVSTINADGTLKNLTRGPKGAGLVMRALEHFLSQEGMPDIAWLKVDRLIDACEAAIELAQGESAGSHSTALPAATETAVEAAARVSKGPNKAKPKEPVIKRPSIVTELGSVNYLAIHDAQELDIPLSPGKKKAAKNYKPPKNHSESDSEEDAEVRLAPDGHEIIDSEPDNSVLPSKRKRIVDSASGSGSTSVSGESDFEDVTTDLAESSDDESVVEIGTKQGNLGTQKEQPLKKRKKKTARRKSKAKRPRKSSEPKQTAKSKTKNPGVPELINVDSIPETDSDTPPAIPGKRGPRNKSLRHYYNPVPVKDKSNELRWSFTCRYCKTVRTVARTKGIDDFELERNVAGLANLASHIAQKHSSHLAMAAPTEGQDEVATTEAGVTKASQAILKSFVERGKLNPRLDPTQNGFNRMVSVWILEDGLPFTASESPGLARIFKYVRVPYKLPSDTTVRAALKDVFNELSNAVTSEVKKVPSKISFSSDAWTTKQMTFSFSGLFGHWITNDWDLRMRLLSFTPLQPDDHKGFYAAISFANTAAKRGALKKIGFTSHHSLSFPDLMDRMLHILAHTMDGASSNDTQAQTTSVILQKKYSIHWAPSNGRIFCMAHGGHRTVQKFLQILEEADDPEIDDYFLHHRSQPIHYSAEDDPGVIEHEAETALASLDEEPETVEEWQEESLIFSSETLSPVKKIHLTCIKIVSTPGRRSVFRSIATKYCPKFKHLMPIRSVATRWNSVLASMERAILLRPAITQWVRRHPELEYLELSNTDWSFIEQIVTVLSLFSGMTLQMSRADTPTLPWALPLYQHISKSLLSLAKPDEAPEYPIPKPGQPPRKALSPKIRNAILGALVVWEKYRGYALTSHFPILATLCHPTFRIRWFEGAAPELEAKARVLFDTLFDSYDSNTPSKEQPTEPATSLSRSASRSSLASSFLEDVLGPLEGDGRSTELPAESEIIRYFRGDGGVSDDPLLWWKAHSHEFPIISQMAKDFLAIPGSSVSVERLFSSARHLCADARSSLQAKTITEAMCSKQWMKEGVEGFTLVRNKED